MKNKLVEHVYIHIPFCLRKCGYCSFYSERFSLEQKRNYLRFLRKEIALRQQNLELKPKTIYLGGGTPSLLSAKDINSITDCFDLFQIEEITLETNPISINKDYAKDIAAIPVSRISLGIQSFKDEELKLLGRLHNSAQGEAAYEILRKIGIKNISLDLMYGLPNQTLEDLQFTIEKFIQLEPEHISTYCLSLADDVPLYPLKSQIPMDEIVSDFYFLIREKLLDAGYVQYEISNFAKPEFESKHNLCYWDDKSYLGLGPAAAGYLNNARYTNPSDFDKYFQLIQSKHILKNLEKLNTEDHEKEFIFLSLRKTEGMNLKEFKLKFKMDFLKKYQKSVVKFQQQNLLEIENDFIRLTPDAYFVSNEIFAEFM